MKKTQLTVLAALAVVGIVGGLSLPVLLKPAADVAVERTPLPMCPPRCPKPL